MAQPTLAEFAMTHADPPTSAEQVMANAKLAFPDFILFIESQCR
jgi:hypothetical protein